MTKINLLNEWELIRNINLKKTLIIRKHATWAIKSIKKVKKFACVVSTKYKCLNQLVHLIT